MRWLEFARRAGERLTLADVLSEYGSWLFRVGREQEARQYAEESDRLYKQIGSENTSVNSWLYAEIAWANGHFQTARSLYTLLAEHFALLGGKNWPSFFRAKLGNLAIEEGALDRAGVELERALAFARELGNLHTAVRLVEMSKLFYLQGNLDSFKQYVREALSLKSHFDKIHKKYFLLCIIDSIYLQKPESTARLLAVYDQTETELDFPARGVEKQHYARAEAHARKVLGEAAFESAFADGRKMSLDEALDLALKTVEEME